MATTNTEDILATLEDAAREVYKELGGPGLSETVYANALQVELQLREVESTREAPCVITYKKRPVGMGRIDLLVHDPKVVIETKAIQRLNTACEHQVRGYMRTIGAKAGLLVNFASHDAVECKRVLDANLTANQE